MPQIIEVPGQGRVEFPDGMSDAQIVQAIKRLTPRTLAQTQRSGAEQLASEQGPLDALMISAGRSTDKIVQGVRQGWNTLTGDQATLDQMKTDEAGKDAAYAPLRKARPIITGLGESLPALAVPVGGAGAAFVGRSMLAGAAPGLLEYGTGEDRLKRGAIGALGGAAGGALGLGLGKLMKPTSAAAGISDDAAAAAQRLGLDLSAGQRTQNPALMNMENYLARSPGSSGTMQAKQAVQQGILNTKAAGSMGQAGGDLSEAGFSAAKQAIGSEFERLGAVTKPQIGNDFMQTLADLEAANMARGPYRSTAVDQQINKGLDLAAKGNLSGTAYKEIRSELSNEAKKAFSAGDSTLGQAIKSIRSALDDAAGDSLSAADKKAWGAAREQWAAYKTLTKGNVAEAGNVSPARVAAQLRQKAQGDAFRTGRMNGDLADIGRVGEAVKSSANPNSGQLASGMLYGNPVTGLPMMGANRTGAAVYNSRAAQAYLKNGLPVNPTLMELIERGALPATLPVLPAFLGAQ